MCLLKHRIVIYENASIIYSAVVLWYLIQQTKYKPILYCYAIITYSAVRRDEQPLKINTLFSEKVRNKSKYSNLTQIDQI